MREKVLLQHIWSEKVEVRDPESKSPLAAILEAILSTNVIVLNVDNATQSPFALMENVELLPDVSLGDVLFEELNIDVPANAIVLVEPKQVTDEELYSSQQLGDVLGRVLIDVATSVAASDSVFLPSNQSLSKVFEKALGNRSGIGTDAQIAQRVAPSAHANPAHI